MWDWRTGLRRWRCKRDRGQDRSWGKNGSGGKDGSSRGGGGGDGSRSTSRTGGYMTTRNDFGTCARRFITCNTWSLSIEIDRSRRP